MAIFDQLNQAWINRQYRITYRVVLNGLLASGMSGDAAAIADRAHEVTVEALKRYRQAEV